MASFCTYFNQAQCRSCDWIELDYSKQLEKKENLLRDALRDALKGALALMNQGDPQPNIKLQKSVGSPEREFRDRAKMVVTGTVEKPVIGLQGELRLDEGRELLACPIHHPKLNQLIQAMPEFILKYNLAPYQIAERKGELKALIAFRSTSGEIYLRFILRSKDCVARIKKMLPTLLSKFPELVCVSANIQPIPHAILEGPEEIILTERTSVDHGDLKLAPRAFVQTNGFIAEKLYQTAASWIAEAKGHQGRGNSQTSSLKMLELFCGQGAFSFYAAKSKKPPTEILGIEINEDAVKSANETAQRLDLGFVTFQCEDATSATSATDSFGADLILVNPPRRGLGDGVKLLQKAKSQHILYSSCEVETLASDLKILAKDYVVHRVQLFDMFPHTRHFETLVWLTRLS
jgi:23S rRNA (uracil747-C5)-methyltransferase